MRVADLPAFFHWCLAAVDRPERRRVALAERELRVWHRRSCPLEWEMWQAFSLAAAAAGVVGQPLAEQVEQAGLEPDLAAVAEAEAVRTLVQQLGALFQSPVALAALAVEARLQARAGRMALRTVLRAGPEAA